MTQAQKKTKVKQDKSITKMSKKAKKKVRVRDYKREYEMYHALPEQIERRAARNKSRKIFEKLGMVKKGDKKDVHHIDFNPLNMKMKNMAVTTRKENRSLQPKRH